MYRNLILDFLTTKHLMLAEHKYYQMTICQIGCNYKDSPIKFIKNEDEINVYHIKEPRVYHKNYDFTNLESTIIMMIMEMKEEVKFNKDELSFEMLDPYYLKNLEELDFVSLQATPIYENDQLIGAVITYYKQENGYIKFSNNELVKLLNNLTEDRIIEFNVDIDNNIVKNNEYYKIIVKDNNYYLNDNAKKKLKLDDNLVDVRKIKHPEKLVAFIRQHGMKKFEYDKLTIYHMDVSKLKTKKKSNDIYAMYNINEHGFSNSFTYAFIRISPLSSFNDTLINVNDWINKFDDIEFKIYEFNDETLVILLNKKISKREFDYLKENLKEDYCLLLRSPNEITSNMNMIKISEYLYTIQPEKFVYQDYIDWITYYHEQSLSYSDKFKDFNVYYDILNVDGTTSLGISSYLPLRAILRDSHFISYKTAIEKELIRLTKDDNCKNVFINIPYTLLNVRKTYEDIKKMLNKDCNIWLNIMYDGNGDCEQFIKTVSKYKKFNLKTACDSSVYLNYYLMSSLDLFDAIYIQNEEYVNVRNNPVGLPQAIFQYAIKDYKYLIIENFDPKPDYDYNHPNCYYVIKQKMKKQY